MLRIVPAASASTAFHSPTLILILLAAHITAQTIVITSLSAARARVKVFIQNHDLSASEYNSPAGRIERDGKPFARVSYFGKLWMLDEQGRETFREMNDRGEVAP